MSVAEFRAFLLQRAEERPEVAAVLRKLAELFDGDQNQKVAKYLLRIKQARGL